MDELTESGNELLRQARWPEARGVFERSLAIAESAEALEGLGISCNWLNDGNGVVSALEAAFRLYLKGGDNRSVARVRFWQWLPVSRCSSNGIRSSHGGGEGQQPDRR